MIKDNSCYICGAKTKHQDDVCQSCRELFKLQLTKDQENRENDKRNSIASKSN